MTSAFQRLQRVRLCTDSQLSSGIFAELLPSSAFSSGCAIILAASATLGVADLVIAPSLTANVISNTAFATNAFAASEISVRVQGDIAPACTLTDAGGAGTTALTVDMRAGDITRPGTREFGFTVDCNAPFQYRLEALHGALAFQTDRSPPAGFSARIPYDVAVHIPTSGAPIDDRCNGADLRAGEVRCTFSNSGNEIAQGKSGKLTFAWAPKENPVAGNYHERLTVYISIKQ